ncbi:hypothetical protein [Nocardia bovistercoris]|uniref:Uncharacterized protein n=1 Tax=Nocardia bovistercoris TaxID=2785916 RepID=A0A931IGY3_9NOCA|nr:hypothetical protein [Nocardia bovistercoris]MBH0780196.1 hypothetical protein [Nocardia bovistercoris]
MAEQFPESIDRRGGSRSPEAWWAGVRKHPLRYRVLVVAPSALDAVRGLGGWMFDMTAAGWEVTVLAHEHRDPRALAILGVDGLDLDRALAMPVGDASPDLVAVAHEMYRGDVVTRERVLHGCGCHRAETMVWGRDLPMAAADSLDATRHRVSAAGRAFKACALRAAGIAADASAVTETLWVERSALRGRRGRVASMRVDQAVLESNSATVALLR